MTVAMLIPEKQEDSRPQVMLTRREQQVLAGITVGYNNVCIARELHISEDTVKTHVRRMFRKLGVSDRSHAVTVGFELNIVPFQMWENCALDIRLRVASLSARELQVLRCIAQGKSNRQIAAELKLSHLTIKSHLARMARRLGTGSRSKMVTYFCVSGRKV